MCIAPLQVFAGDPQNVRNFGATGDDSSDDTAAFVKALKAGRNVYVPEGVYRVDTIDLPDNTFLHGAGRASVIRCVHRGDTSVGLNLGSSCRVSNLRFTSTEPFQDWMTGAGGTAATILKAHRKQDIEIDHVQIDDYLHLGIFIGEGCADVRITNCTFERLFQSMELDNCQRIHVIGNRIREMRGHGIQFWGQSNFTRMLCQDLVFANNYVYRGGSGAIWGTGARRVVMSGNIIDGAKDVGLDLEWCYDCVITGNTTTNCWNAGIALFLSCKNVAITGNSVFISDEGQEGRHDGIMLTGVNRKLFRKDFGHRQVSITGNTIYAQSRGRHGISIGSGQEIVCDANVMHNADILDRTGRARLLDAAKQSDVASADVQRPWIVVPLNDNWRFAIDPDNQGLAEGWFEASWDDSAWKPIRAGEGWESQGFGGKDGLGYAGYAWYRVTLPEKPSDRLRRHAYLHVGMADEQAWVYVDGQLVGEHTVDSQRKAMHALWDEPFSFDIAESLEAGGPHLLSVRVHNAARAGGLRRGVFLILSDEPLDLSSQISAVVASREQNGAGPRLSRLLDAVKNEGPSLLRQSFESRGLGDDPDPKIWSFGKHGNDQWEGDTTFVVEPHLYEIPPLQGDNALCLQQFSHNNEWDVCGHAIARFSRQTSDNVHVLFAVHPRSGLMITLGNSRDGEAACEFRFDIDGQVQRREGDQWQPIGLKVEMDDWNVVRASIEAGATEAVITLNGKHQASLPVAAVAVDQVQFRVHGYGQVLLDGLHAWTR